MKKRLISIVIAFVLIFGSTVTVFACDDDPILPGCRPRSSPIIECPEPSDEHSDHPGDSLL